MSGELSTAALIKEFVEQAIVHATAKRASKANDAARKLAAIYREFRDLRPVDLAEFLRLVAHDHDAVRLWAATYGLESDPGTSERVLEALSRGAPGPIRASATMTLREWRSGRLKVVP